MADVTIEARPNGPYVITGTVELRDTNGVIRAQWPTALALLAVNFVLLWTFAL